jgi:hypothetical protein
MSEGRLLGIHNAPSAESAPRSEVELDVGIDVGIVLLSDSVSESKSVATGVPRASSSAFTTEMECFLIDLLLLTIAGAPGSSETPANFELSFSCT